MSRRLIVRPETEADITDAAVWYDSREPGLGFQLISEVHSAIARALKNPESFTRVRRNPTVRREEKIAIVEKQVVSDVVMRCSRLKACSCTQALSGYPFRPVVELKSSPVYQALI